METKMQNEFPIKIRSFWDGWFSCLLCQVNQNLELHHILGRRSDSMLNSAAVCHICHSKGNIHSPETELELLEKTWEIVTARKWQFSYTDLLFIVKYKDFYEEIANN